ncbi:MAG: MoaD/ThiS family protein [Verrucomicrobia bacterium]|nr:MoaD/ThiS family protein [Verrucomicrobiota bacterium]
MKNINIHYFAALRDQTQCASEVIQTEASTPAILFAELKLRHALRIELDELKVAINDAFAPMNTTLSEGDTIVYLPPVSGG